MIEAEFSLSNGAMNPTFNTVEGLQVEDLSRRCLRVMQIKERVGTEA